MGQRRCATLDRGLFAIEAERGVGIEEAIRQQSDVERAPEMREHCAQALGINDPARKVTQLVADKRMSRNQSIRKTSVNSTSCWGFVLSRQATKVLIP